ncbi:precorrin-6A/cobalt-precorrin-6A reductase [Frankia sp. CNm7]|uniref:Precorrin-6A/cobalt-precorrin-6A reductase n=1 Tax=Frankia nepalensis TaxID=1836974 RepID=A0A937RHP3_9ACTN|nr:precorrin-6A/cobalt-precorrin-6A reductase [Frankia nepalensis]MBL7495205.1 precorrin-6A/cobalt-precorrin-6A reductase [Frankia nepalensis]MBL7515718.1 precorrin-6A/cobalt-precorrin-6A reductase [Frankia nepalensis]MBL7524930.1 precorrin-6A/cobalt-precorrin-6A reductase [Frankia nepalensis]MBL7632436.1 precorrin-6A/cobalt-precorrin-6A reductase [Frankia nepalensis]
MRVLILGGTREARDLAAALVDEPGVTVTTSLAGRVRDPALPAGETVIGGFGGVAGLRAFLRARGIEAVVDATHPFAATMSAHAVAACAPPGHGDDPAGALAGDPAGPGSVPLLQLTRPGWTPGPGDDWHRARDLPAAADRARALCPPGRGVFVTTGRRQLAPFATDRDRHYLIRAVDPPTDVLPPRHTVVLDRGPYTVDGETRLLRAHDVRVLVTKDSGGALTVAKLDAARTLGLPVVMVDRPAATGPVPPTWPDVAGVLAALRGLAAGGQAAPPA